MEEKEKITEMYEKIKVLIDNEVLSENNKLDNYVSYLLNIACLLIADVLFRVHKNAVPEYRGQKMIDELFNNLRPRAEAIYNELIKTEQPDN